jgi:hypothetical protein
MAASGRSPKRQELTEEFDLPLFPAKGSASMPGMLGGTEGTLLKVTDELRLVVSITLQRSMGVVVDRKFHGHWHAAS